MDENNKEINKKPNRDLLKWIIIGIIIFVYSVGVFGAGLFIGGMKVKFSYRWAENYHRNFGGPKEGFMSDLRMPHPNGEFIQGHGIFGEIIKIGDSDFVIKGQDDVEKIIIIKDDTLIIRGRMKIGKEELRVSDYVIIIGSPNEQGQIEAKLIRFFNKEGAELSPKVPFRPFL